MKLCKDCTYCNQTNPALFMCSHPDNPGMICVVTGKKLGGITECSVVRADPRRCGMTAQWFDPATLDARLEMLEDNSKTIYLLHGGDFVKAYAFRSTAEKNRKEGQEISAVEFWERQ